MIGNTRFLPLIGVSFCKLFGGLKIWVMILSFRPLIGVSFCKLGVDMSDNHILVEYVFGFRPLIGVSFCKPFKKAGKKGRLTYLVSVPLSGLVSVNPTPSKPL